MLGQPWARGRGALRAWAAVRYALHEPVRGAEHVGFGDHDEAVAAVYGGVLGFIGFQVAALSGRVELAGVLA